MARTPTSVLLLTRLADEHGVASEVCLRGTGLESDQLRDAALEVTAKQELAVISNLLGALGHPTGLGLKAGAQYHLTTYGIWGFALISSQTLGSAIELGLRFLDLTFAFTHIQARRIDDELQFHVDAPDLPAPLRRFVIEREFSGILLILREASAAPIPITRASFTFPPPDSLEPFLETFGVTPEFEAAANVLACDRSVLEVPLPQANEHTAALAQSQCRDLLERRRSRSGLSGKVRDLIVAHLTEPPAAEQIAQRLHLSGRTMRQRLAAEGTSFRELLNEVRERLAEEMLAGGLTAAQTAERLGYVELSSFSQAFRRWKGVGPRAYRGQHVGLR